MSLTVHTDTPRSLLKSIREAIEDGSVTTWEVDSDGDFTHSPEQWRNRAWMHVARIEPKEKIIFGMLGRKNFDVTREEYAVYHGRFAEMLLAHFDTRIRKIEMTSLASAFDCIKGM